MRADEEERARAHQRDRDALLYDYSKHLLSLALLGIGGIVSLTQSPVGQRIAGGAVVLLICFFAMSGACALTCTEAILRARQDDAPTPRKAWLSSRGAMLFLGMGIGAFLLVWIEALLK